MSLSYAKACLIGALMESLAYGLYFCLFLQSSSILVKRISRGQINCSLFATNLLLFVLITLRMVLDNHAVVQAFTRNSSTPNAAEIYFTQFGKGSLWRTGTYVSLTLVADLFIVSLFPFS
ncbi:hypothetical protein DL96DRAFT_1459623 [Flagelloscypha sp. PMI_526]|nr:hypothetical protein DL96DRAFT_1459623 [Flagelloscypha sp. PMI_526]